MSPTSKLWCTLATVVFAATGLLGQDRDYRARQERLRVEALTYLRSEQSPLVRVTKFRFPLGNASIGGSEVADFVLPVENAPAVIGFAIRSRTRFLFRVADGIAATLVDGTSVREVGFPTTQRQGRFERLMVGELRLTFQWNRQLEALYISADDMRVERLNAALPQDYYPIDEDYRIEANWVPLDKPITITIGSPDEGNVKRHTVDRYAEFQHQGEVLRLYPVPSNVKGQVVFMFSDETAPRHTYGGGRWLTTEVTNGGKVILDFNEAFNPMCGISPYWTCQLPPPENRLHVRIEAGEKNYPGMK